MDRSTSSPIPFTPTSANRPSFDHTSLSLSSHYSQNLDVTATSSAHLARHTDDKYRRHSWNPSQQNSHSFNNTNSPFPTSDTGDNPYTKILQLEHQYSQLEDEYKKLQKEHSDHQIRLQTLQEAYTDLLVAIEKSPALSSPIISYKVKRYEHTDPRPSDLKEIQFWKLEDYVAEKKKRKSVTGASKAAVKDGNTMTWYVQDKSGKVVSPERVTAMRHRARAVWWLLVRLNKAPVSWSKASVDVFDLYEFLMVDRFPELSFCEDNWKAHQIATDNYPSWYIDNVKDSVKAETTLRIKSESVPPPPAHPRPQTAAKRRAASPPPTESSVPLKKSCITGLTNDVNDDRAPSEDTLKVASPTLSFPEDMYVSSPEEQNVPTPNIEPPSMEEATGVPDIPITTVAAAEGDCSSAPHENQVVQTEGRDSGDSRLKETIVIKDPLQDVFSNNNILAEATPPTPSVSIDNEPAAAQLISGLTNQSVTSLTAPEPAATTIPMITAVIALMSGIFAMG
ncbi:hypothetical protein M413DRAFT_31256 [Hebeloma cylindrosporum]|uniref:Uncharacterized protein n=1 Tax=Hebeloma cylindrosporum TaxID=76867 RepID=A0A0C3BXR0_HEBCY|nr:hypothetical protein M413DRAFT_31256 [Hebeloma cylindrosporum h7]